MAEQWLTLAHALANRIDISEKLDDEWREAFAAVPRHQFVPAFHDAETDRWVTLEDAPGRLLPHVYDDNVLITQIRASSSDGDGGARRPTSSSSMPTIMAWMLQRAGVSAGDSVLEIGTGTGYNAALLSHRLGADHVTSVELDDDLVTASRKRLEEIGYSPTLVVGDGAAGHPDNSPYDAIIATAAVDRVPPAWIDQLKPDGRIVADLRGGFSGAMTTFSKVDSDTVEGRCHDFDAAFMPMRVDVRYPLRGGPAAPLVMDRRNPYRSATGMDLDLLSSSPALRLVVELQIGAVPADLFWTTDEVVVSAADDSWATAAGIADHTGLRVVQQGGPRRLWDSVEAAYTIWDATGRPSCAAFGVTATTCEADQCVWLGDSTSPYSWPLPL